jgi:hypothetical protein
LLTVLAAALGLPQIALAVGFLILVEDVEWMAAPIALPPGIVALPFLAMTIYRLWVRRSETPEAT